MSTLAGLGEFGLIDRICDRFRQPDPPDFGIGDDCALLTPTVGMQLAVSTDLLTEGVHFDCSYTPAHLLGRKSLAVNLSDLAAMGARPRAFFLSLALPPNSSFPYLESLLDGLAEIAAEYDCILAGGDTCGSRSGLSISVTIIGEQHPERMLMRTGARPGDLIWVTGTLGDAAAGLHQAQSGVRYDPSGMQHLLLRQFDPTPRVALGHALAESGCIHSMIDISDGVFGDLGHIIRASQVGAEIMLSQLPLSPAYRRYTASNGDDLWEWALTGGEDYELCFTADAADSETILKLAKTAGIPATIIGTVTKTQIIQCIDSAGGQYLPRRHSYTHF